MKNTQIKLNMRIYDGVNDGQQYVEYDDQEIEFTYENILGIISNEYELFIATEDDFKLDIKAGEICMIYQGYQGEEVTPIVNEYLEYITTEILGLEIKTKEEQGFSSPYYCSTCMQWMQ